MPLGAISAPSLLLRRGALVAALPALSRSGRAAMLSSGAPAAFDGEVSALYSRMFEQHMHERGPWKKIISAMESSLPSLAQGGRVLDLGTGPGEPANMIARGMPAVSVCATDPSDDMLNKARARMSGLPNVQFAQVDAQDLSRYEDESFDAVTACYVYMFPEDKERALRETYRVLKPGGKLFATYWTELAMMSLLRDTMTGVLGFTPPPPAINPLVLAPDDLFDGMLKDAGFAQTEFSVGAYPFDLGDNPEFQVRYTPNAPQSHDWSDSDRVHR